VSERERRPEESDWTALYERVRDEQADTVEPDGDPLFASEPLRDYRPIHPEPAWRGLARKLAAPFIALALLFWKFKFVLVAIFKFKIFTVAGSMLVSIGAYALLWGWKFAVGFVALLFVHEMGHALEAKRQGLNVSAPVFIPFLGAMILLKEQPQNVWNEFKVAAAGPIIGSLGAVGAWGVHEATGNDFWLALAFVGFLLNLFNLAPISPLDGGRMVAAINPAIWIAGVLGLGALMFFFPSPILILIVILGAFQAWHWWQNRRDPELTRYYEATPAQRITAAAVYLGLAVTLALAMSATFLERDI
jgi:Zn-dependent protease